MNQDLAAVPKDTRVRALNSASNLHRRLLCPGSGHAELPMPAEENDYSREGTLLHWHDEHPEVDRKKLTHEQRFVLDKNKKLRERFLAIQMDQLGIPEEEPRKVFNELEMFLCDASGVPVKPQFPGHADWIYYFPRRRIAFIFDSKFGRLDVPSADVNLQLRCYAVMFAENFDCDHIFCAITHPWMEAPDDFTSVVYTADNLPAFKEEILQIIANTVPEDAPRNPSLDACRYCRAKPQCREAVGVATRLAVQKMKDLSIEELEAIGPDIDLAQEVITAWENRIRYILEKKPELLKRYQFGDSQTQKKVTDMNEAYKHLLAEKLLDPDPVKGLQQLLSCCDVSLPELKVVVAENKGIPQKDAEARIEAVLGDLINKKPKRPPIKVRKEAK